MRKLISVFMISIIILFCCGCESNTNNSSITETSSDTALVSSNTSINTSTTINKNNSSKKKESSKKSDSSKQEVSSQKKTNSSKKNNSKINTSSKKATSKGNNSKTSIVSSEEDNSSLYEEYQKIPETIYTDFDIYADEIPEDYPYGGVFDIRYVRQKIFNDEISGYSLPYCLIPPENYDENKKYPVLLYLHGAGERGSDNQSHLKNMIDKMYKYNGRLMNEAIVICPQCPAGDWWNINTRNKNAPTGALGAAMNLLFSIQNTYSCDENRIYVMGLSMGGFATWTLLQEYPDLFAAGVPICGWGNPQKAPILAKIPIWIYHGTNDRTVSIESSEAMYDAITSCGGNKIIFTRLEGFDHNVWTWASNDYSMQRWLFEQNLKDRK